MVGGILLTVLEEKFELVLGEHRVVLTFDDVLRFLQGVFVLESSQVLCQFAIKFIQLLILLFQQGHLGF